MDSSTLLRQLLRAPRASIYLFAAPMRPQTRAFAFLALSSRPSQTRHLSLPRIVTPSFWISLIPKPLRRNSLASTSTNPPPRSKEWNPATPYIVLGLLVGSQAIQILWLKRDRERFLRKAEAKIGVLREVIEKVQKGEEVDVEGLLGVGAEGEEKEWEEVMRDVQEEELLFRSKKDRRALREAAAAAAETAEGDHRNAAVEEEGKDRAQGFEDGKVQVETYKGARFY